MSLRIVAAWLLSAAGALPLCAQVGWSEEQSIPRPDWSNCIVYDSAQQRTLSFWFAFGIVMIHEFDGTSWTALDTSTAPPFGGVTSPAVVYDPIRALFVLTLGMSNGQMQTWEWDRTTWTLRNTRSNPTMIYGLTFHPPSGRVFGITYQNPYPNPASLQFYEWQSPNWVLRVSAPGTVDSFGMAWHGGIGEILIGYQFGGQFHTYSWDLTRFLLISQPTPLVQGLAVAYDSNHQRMLGYSNSPTQDTFELVAGTWQRLEHGHVPPYSGRGGMLVHMPSIDRFVMMQNQPGLAVPCGTYLYAMPARTAASYQLLGPGCAGSAGIPTLTLGNGTSPLLGTTFVVGASGLPTSSTLAILCVGFDTQQWNGVPLPRDLASFGMPGCSVYAAPSSASLAVTLNATANWTLALPTNLDFLGTAFVHQAIVLDPQAPNPLAAVVSDAMAGVIGW